MKRKILVGLMIFLAGAMFTACGSKKSSSGTPIVTEETGGEEDLTSTNKCDSSCTQSYHGQYEIHDPQLYMDEFGYNDSQSSNGAGGLSTIQSPFNTDGSYNKGFGASVGNCLFGGLIAWGISELTDSDTEFGCGYSQTNTNTVTDVSQIASSYPADAIVDYTNGGKDIESVVLNIHNRREANNYNGDVIEFTQRDGDPKNTYYNYSQGRDKAIILSGRNTIEMINDQNRPLGTFRL